MNNKNKTFQTTLLFTTLLAALASGTCSYGMVQWKQGESSSQASLSSLMQADTEMQDNANQEAPGHQLESDQKTIHLPSDLLLLVFAFASDDLQNTLKTDSYSLLIMRLVAQSQEKSLKSLNKSNAAKLASLLYLSKI